MALSKKETCDGNRSRPAMPLCDLGPRLPDPWHASLLSPSLGVGPGGPEPPRPQRRRGSAPAAPRHEPTRPARPASQLLLASRPPGPQGGAREAAAKGPRLPSLVRAAAPARRLHADCGGSPRPSLRRAAALVRAPATVTFIFFNDGGRKAKAKTA